MKKYNLNRPEKIQFLNNFRNGISFVNEIIPQFAEVWILKKAGYMNIKTKKVVNSIRFDSVKKRIENANGILMIFEEGQSLSIFGTFEPSLRLDEDSLCIFLEAMNNGYKIEQFKDW